MKQTISHLIPNSGGNNIASKTILQNCTSEEMKQLVSVQKTQSSRGFDLCPKKFKYLVNPALLDKVFSNQIQVEKILETKRPRHLDKYDSMHTTQCSICSKEFLLPVENPVCTSCRGVY